jgi:hypothetical protein
MHPTAARRHPCFFKGTGRRVMPGVGLLRVSVIGMKYKLFIFIFCLAFGQFGIFAQTKTKSPSVKTISLRQIARYEGKSKTLKIANVVLEDVRGFEEHWAYLFQLYDERSKFRRGAKTEKEHPCCIQEFSIFADEEIGKPLLKQKDEWLNKKVNVYVRITDMGLTPLMNIGYVEKVELLNEKGKVEKSLPED